MDTLWPDDGVIVAVGVPLPTIREWISAGAAVPVRGRGAVRGWDRDGVERLAVLGAMHVAGYSAPVALSLAAAIGTYTRVPSEDRCRVSIYDATWVALEGTTVAQIVDRGRLVRVDAASPLGRAVLSPVMGDDCRPMIAGDWWWRCRAESLRVQVLPGVVMPPDEPLREGIITTTVDLAGRIRAALYRLGG